MERTSTLLLPLLLLLAAGLATEGPHALRGPHDARPFTFRQPALRGGARPIALRGAFTDVESAPWLLIAARSDAPARGYDVLARHLASHGCAAFAAERQPAAGDAPEPWWTYADALGATVWQVGAEVDSPESPFHGRVDPGCLLLVADGDGALALASVAAKLPNLRGLVLIDPPPPGPALSWLARVHAPFLAIATHAARAGAAEAWFNAAAADGGQRWLVELQTERPLSAAQSAADTVLQRDLRALITAFVDVQANLRPGVAPSFAELASRGAIDRKVRGGASALPIGDESGISAVQR